MSGKRTRYCISIITLATALFFIRCAGFYDYARNGVPMVYAITYDSIASKITIHVVSESKSAALSTDFFICPRELR